MSQLSIYDEWGLLYVLVEILPTQEDDDSDYENSREEIEEPKPQQTMGFGFSRIPVAGEWIEVGGNLWVVRRVIHYNMSPEKVEETLTVQGKVFVAKIQVEYYGVG